MNTNIIIKKCIEIPGISLKNNPTNIELCMEQDDGRGSMTFFSIFPGISIAYIFINSPTWPTPDLPDQDDSSNSPLLLNYCVTGRCELFLDNNSLVYLKNGEFSISKKSAQKQYTYPLRIYEGLEFFIEIDTISALAPYINDVFNINVDKITDLYSLLDKTYISQCSEDLKHILTKIWALYDEDAAHAIFMMKVYTLQLLELILCRKHIPQPKSLTFFTATQVEIAQKTERIITADLKQHHPAWKIAKLFSISETSLKNYFREIYGQNISVYLREVRMNEAAKMLEKTKMPISKISEQVGYMNQSKFASVFKLKYNMSPLEYRRKKVLEDI